MRGLPLYRSRDRWETSLAHPSCLLRQLSAVSRRRVTDLAGAPVGPELLCRDAGTDRRRPCVEGRTAGNPTLHLDERAVSVLPWPAGQGWNADAPSRTSELHAVPRAIFGARSPGADRGHPRLSPARRAASRCESDARNRAGGRGTVINRREFLRGGFFRRSDGAPDDGPSPPVVRHPRAARDGDGARAFGPIPLLRPPGAIREDLFLERCTKCLDCAVVCPYGAIRPAPARYRSAAGTP
ncbi:MAG: 4Fe-4S binding protein, partial [Candidatus Eisenbacteria bacterium]|nr:4Fe-4S binding protein [Candidatus Eisenbacteria bacterium]